MIQPLKNGTAVPYFLGNENNRNTHNGMTFIALIQRAWDNHEVVMVGHHFVIAPREAMRALDLSQNNEIPSADTLIFDHDVMGCVFGKSEALRIMAALSQVPREARETLLASELAKLPPLPATDTEPKGAPCACSKAWQPLPTAVPVAGSDLL